MFIRFDMIPNVTDRQTDRRTDRRTPQDGIDRAYVWRGKKNRRFHVPQPTLPHVVSPGDAPGAITLNVVWMERKFDAYKLTRSMYASIFNSFPVIRTASAKNRHFHVPQPTVLFPLETPLRLSRNMLHGWKDNSNACQAPRSIYLSIFNTLVWRFGLVVTRWLRST